ncbi:MAG TPA: radical SAM protein [Bdellovibrionota bacterium]
MGDVPYCTAPWMEVHLGQDGQTRPCDHNHESLGSWKELGLEGVWRGEKYRHFRETIAKGEFPSEKCRSCYLNKTTSNLYNSILLYLHNLRGSFLNLFGRDLPELHKTDVSIATQKPEAAAVQEAFRNLHAAVVVAGGECGLSEDRRVKDILDHVLQLGEMAQDYLSGNLNPRYVGPIRQARLINKCNARCVMCAGKFNGDIINGPGMEADALPEVLHGAENVLSFSSEASEFLLFPQWRQIVERLAEKGVPKLRLFTNGMLLNPENVRFLIDNRALEQLLISMNGASKEVLEAIQVNVRYERLLENIRCLIRYARETKTEFQLSFSFIVMRRNFHEMPRFVELVNELAGGGKPRPVIYFPYLESNNGMANYREFLFGEHHSLVEEQELLETYRKTNELAKKYGIFATFKEVTLENFLSSGEKISGLPFQEADIPLLKSMLAEKGSEALRERLLPASPAAQAALDLAGEGGRL